MKTQKTLSQYAADIAQAQQSPPLLADILTDMSIHYAYLSEQHSFMKLQKAKFQNKAKFYYTEDGVEMEREKPISDSAVETKWRITEAGKKEYQTNRDLKTMEKLMSNLRSILSQRKAELQNLNQ